MLTLHHMKRMGLNNESKELQERFAPQDTNQHHSLISVENMTKCLIHCSFIVIVGFHQPLFYSVKFAVFPMSYPVWALYLKLIHTHVF